MYVYMYTYVYKLCTTECTLDECIDVRVYIHSFTCHQRFRLIKDGHLPQGRGEET